MDNSKPISSVAPEAPKENLKTKLRGFFSIITSPITAPARWIYGDIQKQKEFVKNNLSSAINRQKSIVNEIEKKQNSPTGQSIYGLDNNQKIFNLTAIENKWKLYAAAYTMCIITIVIGLYIKSFSMIISSPIWMIFFGLHCSRLAWSSHQIKESILKENDFEITSFKQWIKTNWKNNLPLPPSC